LDRGVTTAKPSLAMPSTSDAEEQSVRQNFDRMSVGSSRGHTRPKFESTSAQAPGYLRNPGSERAKRRAHHSGDIANNPPRVKLERSRLVPPTPLDECEEKS